MVAFLIINKKRLNNKQNNLVKIKMKIMKYNVLNAYNKYLKNLL
jgi:hypothetical protein